MKTKHEIKETLDGCLEDRAKYKSLNTHMEDEDNNEGWIEALQYVLGKSKFDESLLPEEFVKILDKARQEIIYYNGLRNISGSFCNMDVVDVQITEDEDGEEIGMHYVVEAKYGVQDETTNVVNTVTLKFDKETFKEIK